MNDSQVSSNVVWHKGEVSRADREKMNGHKGAVLWFTGLSGSGKSTLSHAVENKLFEMGVHTTVLDGDNVRHGLCGDLGFSDVARRENIRRIGEVSKLFVDAGVVVLTAFISPFREDRAVVRKLHQEGDFIEVYCAASLEKCEIRDVKGLYKRARSGEIKDFTGISSPYEEPKKAEVFVNTGDLSLEDSVEVVIQSLQDKVLFEVSETKAVILAGGSGTRLWPMSRQGLPKQFLKLGGEESLLAATISRLSPMIEQDNVWVVTNEEHATGEAFSELNHLHTILEPCARNTAPAIALAAALLQKGDGDPVMLVLPADHIIKDIAAFHHSLKEAIKVAEQGKLVTFGIVPEHPDTGFGYIQAESDVVGSTSLPVKRFTEKPDLITAKSFLKEGGYFWNSGMFVWKASTILAELKQHQPEIYNVVLGMQRAWQAGEAWQEVVRHQFQSMPSVSIDYAVLEASDNVVVVPVSMGWSDVGSWDAVFDISEKDNNNNAISGHTIAIDCKNTLLRSESRLIAAVGLENIVAVETADAILLCPKGESQRVREVVEVLKASGSVEHHEHVTVQRPWGSYTVLDYAGEGYKLKRIEVSPDSSLSLQRHQHRSEHWVVVSGTATVTREQDIITVAKNESVYIPIGVKHRLSNLGKIPLQMIEVQVGDYLEEDDIERFDDAYGRV